MTKFINLALALALFISFSASAQGITANEILVGQTAGYTGIVAGGVAEAAAGARLYIDFINANGGVKGRKIRLESLDDAFDPKKAAENAKILINEKRVFAMFLNRGTPTTEAILPILKETGTPLIAPSTGAMIFHDPVNPLIFNVRSKYETEGVKAIQQLVGQGIKKIAVIHVDDSFGKDGLAGYLKGFKVAGIAPAGVFSYDRVKADVTEAVTKSLALKPEAIVTVGAAKPTSAIVKAVRAQRSYAPVVTLSNNSAQSFIKELADMGPGVIVMQVFPDPRKQVSALASEMQRLAGNKKDFSLSHSALEGFAAAKVLVEGLNRAGKTPTRESFMAGLERMKDFDLGEGLIVSYGPNDHSGLSFAEPSIINSRGGFTQ
jgi:branched-chain amino acid transport system substrate-binding protein